MFHQVSNFSEEAWSGAARLVVARGCLLKFGQDAALRAALEATGDTMLVECAPRDRRWGVGLGAANPRAVQPDKWRGSNWLGQCLVAARQALREGEDIPLPAQMVYPAWKDSKHS
jgi:ribA/ribD-fused uncharacterized protein